MTLDIFIGIQNQLSDWFLSFHMVKWQHIGKFIFLEIFFQILAKFGDSGDPTYIFFWFFFMSKVSSSIYLFSQKTVCEINYKLKSRGDFFEGGSLWPPLDLQVLTLAWPIGPPSDFYPHSFTGSLIITILVTFPKILFRNFFEK